MLSKKEEKKEKVSNIVTIKTLALWIAERNSSTQSKSQVEEIIRLAFERMSESLCEGKVVKIPNLFSLYRRQNKKRVAVNLRTREKMIVPESFTVKIRVSPAFKASLNRVELDNKEKEEE